MAERPSHANWTLERIERELAEAQAKHEKLLTESKDRIRALKEARDAKLEARDDPEDDD